MSDAKSPMRAVDETLAAYRVRLSKEIMEGVEKDGTGTERLLHTARRLADVTGDGRLTEWVDLELVGYPWPNADPGVHRLMSRVGRLTSGLSGMVTTDSASTLDQRIRQLRAQVEAHTKNIKGTPSHRPAKSLVTLWQTQIARTIEEINRLLAVARRIRDELHRVAVSSYHRYAYSEIANQIFDRHKAAVDELLADVVPEVLDKIPVIYDRLAAGEQEALAQAMNSCRRMIASFADVVQPPQSATMIDEGGNQYGLNQQQVCNRIQEYLKTRCSSNGRVERLNKTVRFLWDRVSNALKNDVTPEEGQSLFLLTYLTLGEILAATRSESGEPDVLTSTATGEEREGAGAP